MYLFLMLCGEGGGMGGVSTFISWDNIYIFVRVTEICLDGELTQHATILLDFLSVTAVASTKFQK